MIGAAIDVETTGDTAGKHEIIEITILLHDEGFNPKQRFTSQIKPMRPEIAQEAAMKCNGLELHELRDAATPAQVRNAFFNWHEEIVGDQTIMPLGHNYAAFDKGFLKVFFGEEHYNNFFLYKGRDSQLTAQYLKDRRLFDVGQSTSLVNMCDKFNIHHKAHTSYGDALASLQLYKKLLTL